MKEQARRKSSEVVKVMEVESTNQTNNTLLPMDNFKDTCVSRYGPTPHLLRKNSKKGPDETCPCRGVIYTQNVNRLSGKEKQLESLLGPLVDTMISKGIMTYCVQETWVFGNTVIMVRGHMIFLHNRCERVTCDAIDRKSVASNMIHYL